MATIGPSLSLQSVGPSGTPDIAYSNAYAVFQSPWGIPNQWQICASFADFLRLYGGLSKLSSVASGTTADTYSVETNDAVVQAYYGLQGYFQEKGSNSPGVLFANRVVATSGGPTAASKTFADAGGSNNTTVTSRMPGLPGATTQISIINPSPRKGVLTLQTGTVSVTSGAAAVTGVGTSFVTGATWVGWGIKIGTEYYTILSVTSGTALTLSSNAASTWSGAAFSVGNNTTAFYIKANFPQAGIVEEWDIASAADTANVSKLSQLITVTLPSGGQLPSTAAASKLQSGTTATADSYGASASDYVGTTTTTGVKTGLQVFNDQHLGTGIVIVPGQVNSTVRSGIKTHCETFFREGFLGSQAGLNLTTATTEFAGVSSNFVAGWAPRVWVPDQNSTTGGNILIDPVGHLAGLQARMDRDYGGPHKSPAGSTHGFSSVVDVERPTATPNLELFDDSGSGVLADSYVNTIRAKNGGICSWGLRTLGTDERYRQINASRTVCLVYLSCFQLMEKKTFEPIDSFGKLFASMKADLDSFFYTLWRAGTLYGTQPAKDPDPANAWFVVCDRSNNPNVSIGRGEVRADVSFVPTLNAEKITLPIYVAAPGFGAAAAGVF